MQDITDFLSRRKAQYLKRAENFEQVRRTHGDNRHAMVYLAAAELAKTSIDV